MSRTDPLHERRSKPVSTLNLSKSTSTLNRNTALQSPGLQYPLPVSSTPTSQRKPLARDRTLSPTVSVAASSPVLQPRLQEAPIPSEVNTFIELCKSFYYNQDQDAGSKLEQILKNSPHSHRREYTNVQADIRAQFHKHVEQQRKADLESLMQTCESSSLLRKKLGISAGSVDQLRSSRAKEKRREQLLAFLRNHALRTHIGPQPFLQSLYSTLVLQSQNTHQGGAGSHLIEWSIDDSVFMEAGGPEFLRESIQLLKGYLGFEDSTTSLSRQASLASMHSAVGTSEKSRRAPPDPPSRNQPQAMHNRDRSSSDPFTDPKPILGHELSDQSVKSTESTGPSSPKANDASAPLLSSSVRHSTKAPSILLRTRTFSVAPYLTNPELKSLARLFPSWIKSTTQPRFPASLNNLKTMEEGFSKVQVEVPKGHGLLSLSARPRDDGYQGQLLERFIAWLSSLCG